MSKEQCRSPGAECRVVDVVACIVAAAGSSWLELSWLSPGRWSLVRSHTHLLQSDEDADSFAAQIMKRSRSSPGNTQFDQEVSLLNPQKSLPNGNTSRPSERRRSRDELSKVSASKSWLNISHKLSNLSLSSSWAAGHQFLSKSLSTCPTFDQIELLRLYSPEEIANQLTLIDLQVFKAITREELLSVGWNSKEKSLIAPNVVEFTRRFNQVYFWAIEQVLFSCLDKGSVDQQAKIRAEVICYFVKVARKLAELKNLHSCHAIVSALNSSPLLRLTRTWPHVRTRDRQILARLTTLFSDESNFSALRKHINNIEPPGIPYLGMYLKDLVYIKLAHPEGTTRLTQMNQVLDAIMKFQKSIYAIERQPKIEEYLVAAKYIDELEKFIEEDNFKVSLRLEPPSTLDRTPSHKQETLNHSSTLKLSTRANDHCNTLSPDSRGNGGASLSILGSVQVAGSSRFYLPPPEPDFVLGHRKSRSLGTRALVDAFISPRNIVDESVIDDPVIDPLAEKGEIIVVDHRLSLHPAAASPGSVNGASASRVRSLSTPSGRASSPLFEGHVRRKTIMKDGTKPAFSAWIRYWIEVEPDGLVYYPARSLKGVSRDKFSNTSCKIVPVTHGWCAKSLEADSFTLIDPSGRNIYYFKVASDARRWCHLINDLARKNRMI